MALSWLFPRTFTITPTVTADGAISHYGGALLHYDLESTPDKYVLRQIYKAGNKHTGNGRASSATPPYHRHLYQDEHFEVRGGTLRYIINGKEGTLHKGESIMSPAGDRHTFWCPADAKEDLDVVITSSGSVNGTGSFNETFMHNFFGYLSTCTMANRAPNPLQVLRFLDSADVVLADIPFGLGWLLNLVVGKWHNIDGAGRWIGGYIAGYKTNLESEAKKSE